MSVKTYITFEKRGLERKPRGFDMADGNLNIDATALKELERDYARMCFYFGQSHFYRGCTRGEATWKALENLNTWVQIKTRYSHPMNENLKQINSHYRKTESERIMKDEGSNETFIGNDLIKKRWAHGADLEAKSALRKFNKFYEQYRPKQQGNIYIDKDKQNLINKFKELQAKIRERGL